MRLSRHTGRDRGPRVATGRSRLRCRAGSNRSAGFTIVEVILAMFVLLIGMTSILAFLSFGAAMARTARLRTGAASSVEAVVADLEENLFPLVLVDGREAVGEPRLFDARPVPGHAGLFYHAVAVPNPDDPRTPPLEYRVDVELSWSTRGTERSRAFSTLLLRQVPFGTRLRRRLVEGIEPEPVSSLKDQRDP